MTGDREKKSSYSRHPIEREKKSYTSVHDTCAKVMRTYDSLHFCCPVISGERDDDARTRTHTHAPVRLTHERIADATAWERSHSINPTPNFLPRATSTPILFAERRRLAHHALSRKCTFLRHSAVPVFIIIPICLPSLASRAGASPPLGLLINLSAPGRLPGLASGAT